MATSNWTLVTEALPPYEHAVLCQLRHAEGTTIQEHPLVRVEEEDVSWRTANGRHELSFDWNVIAWRYL